MRQTNLKIYGKVQGVFFRYLAKKQADELGLVGWVKNADDGTVEVLAEGEENALGQLKHWCEHGPELAKVEKVDENTKEIEKKSFVDFRII